MGCFYNVYISLYKIYDNSNNINLSLIIKHRLTLWVHRHNTLLSMNLRFQFFSVSFDRQSVQLLRGGTKNFVHPIGPRPHSLIGPARMFRPACTLLYLYLT